jgi:SAM-dependent methyltransferase
MLGLVVMPGPATQQEYWNSRVGEEWARQADRTDKMFAALTQAAFEALKLQPGERVLDIGCGAGVTTLTAARQVGPTGHVSGVDLSRPLLDLGRQRAREAGFDVDFIEADAGAAPIAGAPFDAAVSRFGVMFFDDPTAAFACIRQNLRAGGRIVFISWRSFAENIWTFAPLMALEPMLPAPLPPPDTNLPGPFALSDASKIRAVLAAAGWEDVSIAPWDGPLLVGRNAEEAAAYLLKIGPSARAIAEHNLDPTAAERLIVQRLEQAQTHAGVMLSAACWIVRATA